MKDRAWTSWSQELVDASSQLSAVFTEGCGCQRRGRRRRLTLPTPRCWQDQLQQRPLAIEAAGPRGVQFSLHVNRHSRYEDWTPRPERLDTVEEVSEPHSESLQSLPHDGVRWPEQHSQHTSLGTGTDILNSLNSIQDNDNEKEEMFSQAEMEFRNSFRSLDRAKTLRSQSSEDRTLSQSLGLQSEELSYESNPFEIFQKRSSSSQQR